MICRKYFIALSTATVILILSGFSHNIFPHLPGDNSIHSTYDKLLKTYVKRGGVLYDSFISNPDDLKRLSDYIDRLEEINPTELPHENELAYWINLYNAATLELVLKHYPVESIKEIGGPSNSPWKRNVVSIAGRELSLDEIENNIIRKRFYDARIHFALNCAAVGCPPLVNQAFEPEKLDMQLDEISHNVLNDNRWVRITHEEIQVTKLFQWYEEDFQQFSGSVREFIARYRPEDRIFLLDAKHVITFFDYDWQLNKTF